MKFNSRDEFYFGDLEKSSYEIREELVNNPKHYNEGDIECIDAMKAMLTKEEFIGFLRGNSFKYRWRFKYKDDFEDTGISWDSDKLRSRKRTE